MWYEILPGVAIMWTCLVLPGVATVYFHKFTNDSKEKRIARGFWHWHLLERDGRVSGTGKHYESKGLENIQ